MNRNNHVEEPVSSILYIENWQPGSKHRLTLVQTHHIPIQSKHGIRYIWSLPVINNETTVQYLVTAQ